MFWEIYIQSFADISSLMCFRSSRFNFKDELVRCLPYCRFYMKTAYF